MARRVHDETDELLAEAEAFVEYSDPLAERVPLEVRPPRHGGPAPRTRAAVFLLAWKSMKEQLYVERRVPTEKLPPFVEKYLRMLWDTSEWSAMRALAIGDVAFFIAWLFRLDQVDIAMVNKGFGIEDRALILRYRAAMDGYREVAERRLLALGGKWPPTTGTSSE